MENWNKTSSDWLYNQLVSEYGYSINSLNISFPYEYASKLVSLNWSDMLFAIQHGYMKHQSAIDHAEKELLRDIFPQAALDLTCLRPGEAVFPHSIHPYINELAESVEDCVKIESKDKIMYVLLKWIYEHRYDYDDIIDVLTIICDDFCFPESIYHFAWKYAPMKEGDFGTAESNKVKVFAYWKQFLDEQQKKWEEAF